MILAMIQRREHGRTRHPNQEYQERSAVYTQNTLWRSTSWTVLWELIIEKFAFAPGQISSAISTWKVDIKSTQRNIRGTAAGLILEQCV
jgi:hypothetical protein